MLSYKEPLIIGDKKLNEISIPSGSGRPGRRKAGLGLSNSPGLGLPGPSYKPAYA